MAFCFCIDALMMFVAIFEMHFVCKVSGIRKSHALLDRLLQTSIHSDASFHRRRNWHIVDVTNLTQRVCTDNYLFCGALIMLTVTNVLCV